VKRWVFVTRLFLSLAAILCQPLPLRPKRWRADCSSPPEDRGLGALHAGSCLSTPQPTDDNMRFPPSKILDPPLSRGYVTPTRVSPCLLTCCFVSQLSTNYLSISSVPKVITHCAPGVVVADLHTSICGIASLKSDVSLRAWKTRHSSILTMCARIHSKTWMTAINEFVFSSTTLDIRQPDVSSTIGEAWGQSNCTCIANRYSNEIAASDIILCLHLLLEIPADCKQLQHL
jgi:hypothetical protein